MTRQHGNIAVCAGRARFLASIRPVQKCTGSHSCSSLAPTQVPDRVCSLHPCTELTRTWHPARSQDLEDVALYAQRLAPGGGATMGSVAEARRMAFSRRWVHKFTRARRGRPCAAPSAVHSMCCAMRSQDEAEEDVAGADNGGNGDALSAHRRASSTVVAAALVEQHERQQQLRQQKQQEQMASSASKASLSLSQRMESRFRLDEASGGGGDNDGGRQQTQQSQQSAPEVALDDVQLALLRPVGHEDAPEVAAALTQLLARVCVPRPQVVERRPRMCCPFAVGHAAGRDGHQAHVHRRGVRETGDCAALRPCAWARQVCGFRACMCVQVNIKGATRERLLKMFVDGEVCVQVVS